MYRLFRASVNASKIAAFSALHGSHRDAIAIVGAGDRTCASTAATLHHFHLGLISRFLPDRNILPDETGEGLRRTAHGLRRLLLPGGVAVSGSCSAFTISSAGFSPAGREPSNTLAGSFLRPIWSAAVGNVPQ